MEWKNSMNLYMHTFRCFKLFFSIVIFSILSTAEVNEKNEKAIVNVASENQNDNEKNNNSTSDFSELKIQLNANKYTLKNGLTVILYPDNTVPLVSYHTWYKVGSRDEYQGVTGAAHMLEHMMFKGSKKYSGAEFEKILHENGITNNAFTSYDYTGFYQNLPSSKLEMMMQIEVDRMSSLLLKEEDLLSEREVVKEERRWRVDNNPIMSLLELTMATVFKVHNYKNPVIGTMKDISNFNVNILRGFYEKYYVPNNAVLVLAGDFKVNEAKKMIEKYYGVLQKKELSESKRNFEPQQTIQFNAKLRKEVQNSSFNLVFQSVKMNHQDMYALDLICQLLGSGSSSRLYKQLVKGKELATSAYCSHSNMQDHGVINFHVSLKPGVPIQPALDIVYKEIYNIRNSLVTAEELHRSKVLSLKLIIDSIQTIDEKARALATAEITTGNYENLLLDIDKYQKVSIENIKNVAQKYLNQQQRSIVSLEPKK